MAVPDTTTFSLQDVRNEFATSSGQLPASLDSAFGSAADSGFNSLYSGSKNELLNFRDYDHPDVPDATFLYSTISKTDACSTGNAVDGYYDVGTTWSTTVKLWTTSARTTILPANRWYRDVTVRYWDGTALGTEESC